LDKLFRAIGGGKVAGGTLVKVWLLPTQETHQAGDNSARIGGVHRKAQLMPANQFPHQPII
jgi:hypothetical protein